MDNTDNWQRAFVLHRRDYSESSLIVDVFTEHNGRINLIAKGAKRKNSPWKSLLQPFTPILIKWSGRSGLKTLTKAEPAAMTIPLSTIALYSGFYVNELMVRLIEKETAYPDLFQDYLHCLMGLAKADNQVEENLRIFEFKLLKFLGYAIDFCHCIGSGRPVEDHLLYRYREEQGFITVAKADQFTFQGKALRGFHLLNFSDPEVKIAAKRFIRLALKPYLGETPLKSRELFSKMVSTNHRLKLR